MPVLSLGEERREQGGVVGVVENQEPSGFRLQPLLEGENGLVQVVLGMRKVQQTGEFGRAGLQAQGRLGIEPEDGLVLVAIAVGVLDGGLGLADAAQAGDGLGQGGLASLGELLPQVGDDRLSALEELISRIGDGPESFGPPPSSRGWRWAG